MNGDYKDKILSGDLSQKEIQLLMLQEIRSISEKLTTVDHQVQVLKEHLTQVATLQLKVSEIDKSLQEKSIKIESNTKFKTQIIAALVAINIMWGGIITILKFVLGS